VDIEIRGPNVDQACFNHPPIPPGSVAFDGPAKDCIIDKINEFAAEPKNPATDPEERLRARRCALEHS
jgi:nuclease S1